MELRCRMCGSPEKEIVSSQVAGDPDARVYRCLECSLIYLFPIMTEADEAEFYREQFETYMQGRAGVSWQSPQRHFQSYQAEGERRLPIVRRHLRMTDTVLEIGSSTGYFLDDLRGYVQSVQGVEPSELYCAFANERGISTVASLEEVSVQSFDVLVLYYVLEHLRDPVAYLSGLRRYLKVDGRLLLEVPNVDDVLVSRYSIPGFLKFYWQKAHYHYFSHTTLTRVFKQAGYDCELFPVQRYDLSNHIVWMTEQRPGGTGHYGDIFTPEVEIAYAEALKKQWVCDTLFAVGTVKL
ncbi:MAG: class I SAM-dependent methyltransferase [Nitrospirae bacterium]|nr:class I SAM-dependent methyltransferase [Nitrospirota bacterium]